jgi:4-hydroxy-2-oxoheptanedioate aldolase
MAKGALAVAGRWARNEAALCLCITLGGAFDLPTMAAACGFDAIYVDLEHTAIDLYATSVLCSTAIGAGIMPFVRVSGGGASVTRVLDTGAMGVIIPHVEDESQAAEVVRQCHFPPLGSRSVIGTNRATDYRPMSMPEAIEAHTSTTVVAVMIESRSAVENAEAIASVDGIDMLVLGPYDLSSEVGEPGRIDHPVVLEAMARLPAACQTHGKVAGIAGVRDERQIGALVRSGYRFVSAGTDAGLMMEAARDRANRIRTGITEAESDETPDP